MSYKDKAAEAELLFEQVQALEANEEATADEKARIPEMLAEVKKLQAEALQLKDISEVGAQVAAMAEAERQNKEAAEKAAAEEKAVNLGNEPEDWEDWGEFLYAVWEAGNPNIRKMQDKRLKRWDASKAGETKDLAEATGAGGGFLVPPEYDMTLRAVMGETSIVRSRATIVRMQRRQINIPVLDQTTTTAGQPHWFGGMQFYWAEEAEEKTESDPAFRQIQLVAHKLIGYTRASDELVDDSAISLDDLLRGPLGFGGGVAWMEDYAFLRGTGAGQPLGVILAGATITVNRAAVGTPIQYIDLVNMMESFLPTGRGMWLFNQSAMSNLLTIQDVAGNYVWQPNAREGIPQTLFGFPIMFTEKLPTVGNAGDVLLADWRYYLLGDRQATTIESTKFDRWRWDQTSWRVTHRVDGQPWLSAPLTLQDGTLQVSPFVILGDKTT